MKYTTNYNLYKPDYDDTIDVNFLNQNMDVLDGTVAGLNYVQNVNTSDKGLTFIKRDNTKIQVPLNYLKLTGGNVTGDITINSKPLLYVVEDLTDDSNADYYLRAIKYNDGTLKNIIILKTNIGVKTITFLTPFVSTDNIIVTTGRVSIQGGTDRQSAYTVAKLTTTSFETGNGEASARQQTTLIGRWK